MSEQANRELILSFFSKAWVQWPLWRDWREWWADPPSTRPWRDYKDTGKTERKPSTQKASVRTAPLRKRVWEKIRRDPRRSMRRMDRDKGVSKTTMWRLCWEDLGMIPHKKKRRQVLSEATKAKRLEQGCQILKILRDGTPPLILWMDEKAFHHGDRAQHSQWLSAWNQQSQPRDRRVEPLPTSKTRFHHGLGRGHLRWQERRPWSSSRREWRSTRPSISIS